jgi:hypothetical protein
MTFKDFISQFPDCSIQAYDLAELAWNEQQKKIEILISEYQDEEAPQFDQGEPVQLPKTRIDFGPV